MAQRDKKDWRRPPEGSHPGRGDLWSGEAANFRRWLSGGRDTSRRFLFHIVVWPFAVVDIVGIYTYRDELALLGKQAIDNSIGIIRWLFGA